MSRSIRTLWAVAALALTSLVLVACAPTAESATGPQKQGVPDTSSRTAPAAGKGFTPTLTLPPQGGGDQGQQTITSAPKRGAVLSFSGIPDQDASRWAQRYQTMADYLSRELGVPVKGMPATDYAAVVTAFQRGDIQLAWFGGFTGVQARVAVPGTRAIAQRPVDEQFHSVFIVLKDVTATKPADMRGLTFTFGSESSTSGHLMPRYFLIQDGLDPDKDFRGVPNYSGSHDKTWKLVESGAFQAGVLSEEVWDRAVREAKVDLSKVREVSRTPAYYDYHWGVRGDLDETFGAGFTEKLTRVLLAVDDPKVLELFATDRFIATKEENYDAIEQVGRKVGLIR